MLPTPDPPKWQVINLVYKWNMKKSVVYSRSKLYIHNYRIKLNVFVYVKLRTFYDAIFLKYFVMCKWLNVNIKYWRIYVQHKLYILSKHVITFSSECFRLAP